MQDESPLNPLPIAIVVPAALMICLEVYFTLAASGLLFGGEQIGVRLIAAERFGFSPRVTELVFGQGLLRLALIERYLTYPFVHTSFTHAAFAITLFLALGKFVGETMHWLATVLLLIITTAGAALLYSLIAWVPVPLLGAYPTVYGLIGAYTYVLLVVNKNSGRNAFNAFRLIGILLGIQLVFGIFFGSSITWIAEIIGFALGFVAAPLLVRGGWERAIGRLRRR